MIPANHLRKPTGYRHILSSDRDMGKSKMDTFAYQNHIYKLGWCSESEANEYVDMLILSEYNE